MCICITFMYQGASTCILRAFVCIHVHPRAFHVCIPVHSCASTCIHVHVHFMCIHAHYMCISAHLHAFTPKTLHADACISCAPARALVCIHVHYLDILVYSCAFVSIYLHRSSQLCAFMRITVHQQCIYAIHMTCLHVQSCPTWQELATRCNVSAAFNARTFDQAQRPARARAFFMHLTCIYAHLNHVKECIYNAGKCIVNVMRLRRGARVCGGLIAFVHST